MDAIPYGSCQYIIVGNAPRRCVTLSNILTAVHLMRCYFILFVVLLLSFALYNKITVLFVSKEGRFIMKKLKKTLCILISVLMLTAFMPIIALAEENQVTENDNVVLSADKPYLV